MDETCGNGILGGDCLPGCPCIYDLQITLGNNPHNPGDLLAIVQDQRGGYSGDRILLSIFRVVVRIQFEKTCTVSVILCQEMEGALHLVAMFRIFLIEQHKAPAGGETVGNGRPVQFGQVSGCLIG